MADRSCIRNRYFLAHVLIIALSNYAVQIPINLFGINSTMGTFTYPVIFLLTDLSTRLYGSSQARRIVLMAMLPGLLLSYIFGTLFVNGSFAGWKSLSELNVFVLRIALASFSAYVLGQLTDILVFQRLRRLPAWWPAPASSSVAGNLLDTYLFFSIAFMGCQNEFMAAHWVELATVDYLVKIASGLLLFLPCYGVILRLVLPRAGQSCPA